MAFLPWTDFLPFIYAAAILLVTWAVGRLAGFLLGRGIGQTMPQVSAAAGRLGTVVVWLIGGTFAVQEMGVSADILLLVVLVLGLAGIVALREPLQNIGARYFSDIYTPFKLGDTVRVGPHAGRVIEINPVTTVLLSDDDTLLSVPNSMFIREVVTNTSPQAWREVNVPFSVGTGVDVHAFESELRKSLGKLRARLDSRFPPVLVTRARTAQTTDLTLTVLIRRPEERDAISAEVGKRVAELVARTQSARRTGTAPGRTAPD
jgi:small-conductance mechanosensitive channel